MKYLIPILTFVLFLYGLLIFFVSFRFGIGIYTPLLTITTLFGLVASFANKKIGMTIIFISSLAWLFRYFEHANFLLLYDNQNIGRWLIVTIPILISIILFILIYKSRQDSLGRPFKLKFVTLSIISIFSIGLLSFVRKPYINEFNCWYYFDNNKNDFKITFAIAPGHTFETTSNSDELKNFVLKNGIRDKFREAIYCPETKVKVITRFKEIVGVKILGFRNSTTNYKATLDKPAEIDINKINGDKGILQPDFTLGD